MGIITLLTDFGTVDSYVAEVKAEILSRVPDVTLVDVSHDVPPGDVRAAQYLLSRAWKRFPVGTIHLAIVDPAVGTERRALAAEAAGHQFLAPDNGLLSFLPPDARFVALPVPRDAAPTFHGRDLFAPAAAHRARAGRWGNRRGSLRGSVWDASVQHSAGDGRARRADPGCRHRGRSVATDVRGRGAGGARRVYGVGGNGGDCGAGRQCGQATGRRCGGGGPGLGRPISRRRRNLHLRHHAIGETGARRKLRQLDQLENHLALAIGLDTTQRAIAQVHRPRGGKQPLRPKLDFVGSEVHGEISHWLVLRPPVGTGFTHGALPGSRAIHYGPDGYRF